MTSTVLRKSNGLFFFVVNTHEGTISSDVVSSFIMKNIDLSPKGIIERLKLQRPIYRATAAYGHFGRNEFPWEQLDLVPMFSSLS